MPNPREVLYPSPVLARPTRVEVVSEHLYMGVFDLAASRWKGHFDRLLPREQGLLLVMGTEAVARTSIEQRSRILPEITSYIEENGGISPLAIFTTERKWEMMRQVFALFRVETSRFAKDILNDYPDESFIDWFCALQAHARALVKTIGDFPALEVEDCGFCERIIQARPRGFEEQETT